MTVADTSKQSYRKLDEIKEMSQCDRILEALKRSDKSLTVNELNNTALADLDIPNGRVSARINKLKDNGKVVESDKREDMFTERKAKTWTDLVDDSSTAVVNNGDNTEECAEEEKPSSVEPSKQDEFVSMSEADTTETEDVDGLFVDDKQSDSLEPGDVIYG